MAEQQQAAPKRGKVTGPVIAIIAGLVLYSVLTAIYVNYEVNAAGRRSCAAIVQLASRPGAGQSGG